MTQTEPFDFQCETHDETFPRGLACLFYGRDPIAAVLEEKIDSVRRRRGCRVRGVLGMRPRTRLGAATPVPATASPRRRPRVGDRALLRPRPRHQDARPRGQGQQDRLAQRALRPGEGRGVPPLLRLLVARRLRPLDRQARRAARRWGRMVGRAYASSCRPSATTTCSTWPVTCRPRSRAPSRRQRSDSPRRTPRCGSGSHTAASSASSCATTSRSASRSSRRNAATSSRSRSNRCGSCAAAGARALPAAGPAAARAARQHHRGRVRRPRCALRPTAPGDQGPGRGVTTPVAEAARRHATPSRLAYRQPVPRQR